MNTPKKSRWSSVVIALFASSMAAWAANGNWWNNFEVGTRSTWIYLTDHQRPITATSAEMGSFYGSINQLNPVQDYWPLKLFVDYKFCPYCGIELTYDFFSARTITREDGHTDGDLNLLGVLPSFFVRYPTELGLTPFAGAGIAYYHVNFDEDALWHAPPGRDEIQIMDFDHTYGLFAYGGLMWTFVKNCSVEISVRYTKMDAEGVHWQGPDDGNPLHPGGAPSFPLSNVAASLGLHYSF